MILRIYCVRDRATIQFGNPMFLMSDGQAIRSFTDEINGGDKNNSLNKHPEDFDLYFCGQFDTETGIFETEIPAQILAGKQAMLQTN